MCFPRKAFLGQYSGTRTDWRYAYQTARIVERSGALPNPAIGGLAWKAGLIVSYERKSIIDPLAIPLAARLAAKRFIEKIVSEESETS